MIVTQIPDGHLWLRITRPHYADPFDPSFAQRRGGRWNPPGSWPTLYLNEDLATVHAPGPPSVRRPWRRTRRPRRRCPDPTRCVHTARSAARVRRGQRRRRRGDRSRRVRTPWMPTARRSRTRPPGRSVSACITMVSAVCGVAPRRASGRTGLVPVRSFRRPARLGSPRPYGAWRTAVDLADLSNSTLSDSTLSDSTARNVSDRRTLSDTDSRHYSERTSEGSGRGASARGGGRWRSGRR